MKKIWLVPVIFFYMFSFVYPGERVQDRLDFSDTPVEWNAFPAPPPKIEPAVSAAMEELAGEEFLTVIVTLQQQTDLSNISGPSLKARQKGLVKALQATAEASQGSIRSFLAAKRDLGAVQSFEPFWVFNGLKVSATSTAIQELALRSDVSRISLDQVNIQPAYDGTVGEFNPSLLTAHSFSTSSGIGQSSQLFVSSDTSQVEDNLELIGAPQVWQFGYAGQGIVVASMDSGVDLKHPDLTHSYRGGANSWYDPYGQHSVPTDLSGHGTAVMGVILGGNASGSAIGVAPQAQWIAVKIFNDSSSATASAIHSGFQWLLDPDGNPDTADAPQVVNGSWAFASPGCNLEFHLDVQALMAAGILPVFAAGNYGPAIASSASPANYPESFAVGAVYNTDAVYPDSSRGPSACAEPTVIFPEISAPGVNITTSEPGGFYTQTSGTSLAAPHISGALALLLSAYPGLTPQQQQAALLQGAQDIASSGPDNDSGYGRLNVFASYQWLDSGGASATPTPMPPSNLALGKPVTVSSYLDANHTGSMAVDGAAETAWRSAQLTGKIKRSNEWLVIDMGSSQSIEQVILKWGSAYAIKYTLSISTDGQQWSTFFSTRTGNGGLDEILFQPVSGRYLRLLTSAWSDRTLRVWLNEIEVYAQGAVVPSQVPTVTPTPGFSPVTPDGLHQLHIADLQISSSMVNSKYWSAAVKVLVHNQQNEPLAGATVYGIWSGAIAGGGSCVTDEMGVCQISSGNIRADFNSVVFSVAQISMPGASYQPAANYDASGGSNGTNIEGLIP